ncbi:MAG TPA: hypothetical protein PLN96_11655 [Zoogloea sp.]|uniref:hypothetical protein n=1 Tax=Zoogloea sp. TaxID=49181 RepID=UPI002B658669|nr:hypothetical protein [Zoogloea sp.]HMV64187.1 hypothetical protein [Rhodocyclaceae bacterium]HMW53290.1 hypothetical protein [Rhodocyclaceae bacterium]HMY50152.1 hypothetical protein [Rhodocyclaceae bacterium]HMZ76749.1 hypothetical protein [Rhodocyclaceae bacterium]HNA68669.1 hypothetical protein [Rhodocyclaceae bacterium]
MDRIDARPEAFAHLVYRYLWPYAYFRDVTRGSFLERQQNYRHNRRMGMHLPGFMLKWACLTVFFYLLGSLCEELLELVLPAACCYVTGAWTLTILVQLCVAWLWLKRFPDIPRG